MQTTLKREDRWSQAQEFCDEMPEYLIELKNFARKFFRKNELSGFTTKRSPSVWRNKFDAVTRGPTISGRK